MGITRGRRFLAVIGVLLSCALRMSGAANGSIHRVDLVLEDAYPASGRDATLQLRLRRIDGRWEPRVWGRGYNIADHRGRIVKVEDDGERICLSIDIMISSEPWMTGGPASYTLDLKRDGANIAGTWSGTFRLNPGEGSVSGTARTVPLRAGYVHPAPGEHPRLLFRKEELPALREKAKTPWGRAMLKRLESRGKVSWALLYALTGDPAWADKARAAMAAPENIARWWTMVHGVHDPGAVATEDAIAFDLIYDTCDEAFRTQTLARFQKALPFLFWGQGSGHYNPHDHSNWAVQFRGGVTHAALMLMGEKSDYPPAPWGIPRTAFDFEGFAGPEGPAPRAPGIAEADPNPDVTPGQTAPDAGRSAAVAAESYRILLAEWEAGREEHRRNGGLNPHAKDWVEIGRDRCARYADSLGSFGWNMEGEGYSQASFNMLLPIAHTYERAMGRRLSPRDDMYMLLPLYTAKTVFGEDYVCMQGYGPGGGPQGVDNWARGFGTVPERYRAAVLWAWNHTQRLADKGKLDSVYLTVNKLDDLSTAFMFVNYPVGTDARNPAGAIPRFCEDDERGGYVFRNQWKDRDDIVVTLFANSNCPGGSWRTDECGDFRIAGLGEEWAIQGWGYAHGAGRRPKPRLYMNVLQLSEKVAGRQATVTYAAGRDDGSGVVSMDMDAVYMGKTGGRRPKPVDLGIRGMRSFAVDYSGLSGAPCLVAVVDKVSGTAGTNFWQMCTERRHEIATELGGFTIRSPGGSSLRGTVAAPKAARVKTAVFKTGHEGNYNYHQGHWEVHFERRTVDVHPPLSTNVSKASPDTGLRQADGGEFFLVLMTLQEGRPPHVHVAGEGVNTRACAGERIVRFDGEKVVFESAARGWLHDGTGMAPAVCPPIHWARRKNLLWTAELPSEQASAPVMSRGRIFVTVPSGSVLCLDAQTGEVLWEKRVVEQSAEDRALPPAAREGEVYAAFASGVVVRLDGAGNIRWRAQVEGPVGAPPRLVGGRLHVPARRPVALDVDNGDAIADARPLAAEERVIVTGGLRYSLTDRNEFLAEELATGEVVYRRALTPSLVPTERAKPAPSSKGILLLVGDLLYACNLGADRRTVIVRPGRTFEKVWEYVVAGGGPAWDAPAFEHDRQIIRGGRRLFCIGGDTPALPPAPPAVKRIAPDPRLTETNGLAIGPFRPGLCPERWAAAGPFPGRDLRRDGLAAVGGRAGAVLKVGESVTSDDDRLPVRALDETHWFKHFKFTGDMRSIDITAVLERRFHTTGYFFTVIEVDASRYVRFVLRSPFDRWNPPDRLDARAWLAGEPLLEGELIELAPGRYPLLIQASIGECGGGKIWMAPRFEDETAAYRKQKQAYDETMAWWPEYERTRDTLFVLQGGTE